MYTTLKGVAHWIDDCQCRHAECHPCRRVAVLRTAQAVIDAAKNYCDWHGNEEEAGVLFCNLCAALAAHDQQEKGT